MWRSAIDAIRSQETVRLVARWIFPVSSDPIERGVIQVCDGQIEFVEPLAGRSCTGTFDFGNSAIIPAVVNAHAHLEFSDLEEPIEPPAPFAAWIQNLMGHRQTRQEATVTLAARGAEQSGKLGTTIVGDIVTGDWKPEPVRCAGSQVVALREFIGLQPDRFESQIDLAMDHLFECGQASTSFGFSPHAPYSVAWELFLSLVDLAKEHQRPLSIHLAETRAEIELLNSGRGELVEMLKRLDVWRADAIPREMRPLDYLNQLEELNSASIAHGNYLSDEELCFLSKHPNITTIYCPRTHNYFGHEPHPWRRLLAEGASVALGTDGRSSNPDYSLWAEVLFLDRKSNGLLRPSLLDMATRQGARALGVASSVGTFETWQCAEPMLVQFGTGRSEDPWELLFDPGCRPEPFVPLG